MIPTLVALVLTVAAGLKGIAWRLPAVVSHAILRADCGLHKGANSYGCFRSDGVFCMERRQYIPVGLTAASDRNFSVALLGKSQ